MARWWLVAALGLASCKSETKIELSPGEDASLYSVIALDEEGHLLGATPLAPTSSARSVLFDPAKRTLVIGYSESILGKERLAQLVGQAPSLATGCTPPLPAPTYVKAIVDGALVEAGRETIPPLSAPAWASVCPELPTLTFHFGAEAECLATPCWPTAIAHGDCHYSIEFPGGRPEVAVPSCELDPAPADGLDPPLVGRLDADGGLCIEPRPGWRCERDGRSARCVLPKGCPVTITPVVPDTPPIFDIVEAQIGPPGDVLTHITADTVYDRGVLRDLLPIGDTTVVLRGLYSSQFGTSFCGDRGPDAEAELYFVDAETLAHRSTNGGLCASRLAKHPGGFLATYVEGNAWRVGRYDLLGNRIESVELSPITRPLAMGEVVVDLDRPEYKGQRYGSHYDAVALDEMPGGRAYSVLLTAREQRYNRSELIVLDGSTLAVLRRFDLDQPLHHFSTTLPLGEHELLLVGGNSQQLRRFDIETGAIADWVVRNDEVLEQTLMRPILNQGSILIPANAFVFKMSPSANDPSFPPRTVLHDRGSSLVGIHEWPPDRQKALLFAVPMQAGSPPDFYRPTMGVLFDTTTRTIEPGTWTLGARVITKAREDESGRIWLMMPDLARVARLTPR